MSIVTCGLVTGSHQEHLDTTGKIDDDALRSLAELATRTVASEKLTSSMTVGIRGQAGHQEAIRFLIVSEEEASSSVPIDERLPSRSG